MSTNLGGSGGVGQTDYLGEGAQSEGTARARALRLEHGTARWPRWLEWRGHSGSHMREGQRGNGAPFPHLHTPVPRTTGARLAWLSG